MAHGIDSGSSGLGESGEVGQGAEGAQVSVVAICLCGSRGLGSIIPGVSSAPAARCVVGPCSWLFVCVLAPLAPEIADASSIPAPAETAEGTA